MHGFSFLDKRFLIYIRKHRFISFGWDRFDCSSHSYKHEYSAIFSTFATHLHTKLYYFTRLSNRNVSAPLINSIEFMSSDKGRRRRKERDREKKTAGIHKTKKILINSSTLNCLSSYFFFLDSPIFRYKSHESQFTLKN